MSLVDDVWRLSSETVRDLVLKAKGQGVREREQTVRDAAATAKDVEIIGQAGASGDVRRAVGVVRAGGSVLYVKELAKVCGKAGAAGAVVDGALGGVQAAKYVQKGAIDGRQAAIHVGAEAGCGFVTSSSGTAGTLAVFMVTGTMGPAALAAGMGASMGSRYVYKQIVGETLPDEEELEEMHREARKNSEEDGAEMEDIGPGNDQAAGAPEPEDIEDIGPAASRSEPESQGASDEEGESSEGDTSEDDGPNGADDVWESIGPN